MSGDRPETLGFLPVGLKLRQTHCLVVGGGSVGTRKALALVRAGARVTVVSPAVTGELAEQIQAGRIGWRKEPFREEHLEGTLLVVAATDDEAVNTAVVRAAAQAGALVCDASSAARSQVIFGALLEGEGFTVAVFTGGSDPARAGRVRDRIATSLGTGRPSEPQL
jgi:siroheme synthase-like protein